MTELGGAVGLLVIIGVAFLASNNRLADRRGRALRAGRLRVLVLRRSVGKAVLDFVAGQVEALIGYTDAGIEFMFGELVSDKQSTIFALQVLPVIIFIGALVGLLYYLRVIQWIVEVVGRRDRVGPAHDQGRVTHAATVIFLGQSEAPLMIQSYLNRLTRSELFVVMTAGFASVAGSTLVGYALLGAPLPFLLAATVMNAPGGSTWPR